MVETTCVTSPRSTWAKRYVLAPFPRRARTIQNAAISTATMAIRTTMRFFM